jgi:hypothetical protein
MSTTHQANSITADDRQDSRDRLIRVEERLRHMDENFGRSLRDLKDLVAELTTVSRVEAADARTRITALEKRVDKIYWVWGAAVFIGTPIMAMLTKLLLNQFGL